jgi:hypothetical protein
VQKPTTVQKPAVGERSLANGMSELLSIARMPPDAQAGNALPVPTGRSEIRRRSNRLRDIRYEHRPDERNAHLLAARHLNAEDDRLGNAVDDRANDDAERASCTLGAELLVHIVFADDEHAGAEHCPERRLPKLQLMRFGQQVPRDRRDERTGSKGRKRSHHALRDDENEYQQCAENQRQLRSGSQSEGL